MMNAMAASNPSRAQAGPAAAASEPAASTTAAAATRAGRSGCKALPRTSVPSEAANAMPVASMRWGRRPPGSALATRKAPAPQKIPLPASPSAVPMATGSMKATVSRSALSHGRELTRGSRMRRRLLTSGRAAP